MLRNIILLALFSIPLTACIPESDATNNTITYTELTTGFRSNIYHHQYHVIQSEYDFSLIWNTLDEPKALPTINFLQETVIAVFSDLAPCGPFHKVNGIYEDEDFVTVSMALVKPSPDIVCMAMVYNGQSYRLISIPKTNKPVSFTFERVETMS